MSICIFPSVNCIKERCKAGDKCLFPQHEVVEQPNKKPKEGYYSHERRESEDKNGCGCCEKLYHNWVASLQNWKHWFLEEANSPGETRCKKFWDRLEKYGSLSLRYVKQVSGKRKDHRLEKDKSNLLISEVPTL